MTEAHRKSPDDMCSFHGGKRSEQSWHCRQMFGGPRYFICEECLGVATSALEEAREHPASSGSNGPDCSFCRVHAAAVTGPSVYICAECVSDFAALLERPLSPWCAVLKLARDVYDVLTILAIFDTLGPEVRAGGISLREFMKEPRYLHPDVPRRGLDPSDEREILCWRLLDWMIRVSSTDWSRADQERVYRDWPARADGTRLFVERCRAAGVAILD